MSWWVGIAVHGLHLLVVDEELPAVVTGEVDVLGVDADDDLVDLDVFGVVVDLDADHDRGFIADPPVHCVPLLAAYPFWRRLCGSA